MYCPICSTQAIEGAKFCKSCGMNLSVITQALSGGVVVTDPLRDREFKRSRKQISDGIQGVAIGAALLVVALLAYFLIPKANWVYAVSLVLALAGIYKLFRSVGSIIDAKVGPKLLDPALQPRASGGLNTAQAASTNILPGQRLAAEAFRPGAAQPANTRPVSLETDINASLNSTNTPPEGQPRIGTGRINREHSTPLRKLSKDDDLVSKLRN
jgi:hypothetical protein